jgi:hypothetical protein
VCVRISCFLWRLCGIVPDHFFRVLLFCFGVDPNAFFVRTHRFCVCVCECICLMLIEYMIIHIGIHFTTYIYTFYYQRLHTACSTLAYIRLRGCCCMIPWNRPTGTWSSETADRLCFRDHRGEVLFEFGILRLRVGCCC